MDTILVTWFLATRLTIALASSKSVGLSAPADDISGTIKVAGSLIEPRVQVQIRCGSAVVSSLTDSYGHYRAFVKQTGRCTLTLQYRGQVLSAEVYSYSTPVRYDWSVEMSGATYHLKRT